MPRYDLYHEPVKRALVKDGWSITDDPFTLEYKELRVLADIASANMGPIVAFSIGLNQSGNYFSPSHMTFS
jgi:hypothetical protein